MCKCSECVSTELQVLGTVNFSAKYVIPLRAGSVFLILVSLYLQI